MPQYGSKAHFSCFFATPQHPFCYSLGPPRSPAGVGGRSTPSESTQGVYDRLSKKIQILKISRTNTVTASIWLKSWVFNTPQRTFRYFWVPPRGAEEVGGGSTLSESSQGLYKRLFKKIQTIKISRTHTVSASIWLKNSFVFFSSFLGVIFGTFGVFSGAPGSWQKEHSFLISSWGL